MSDAVTPPLPWWMGRRGWATRKASEHQFVILDKEAKKKRGYETKSIKMWIQID